MNFSEEQTLANYKKVLLLLETLARTLKAANSEVEILEQYSSVLRFLRSLPKSEILRLGNLKQRPKNQDRQLQLNVQIDALSLDEIERITLNEKTPRKVLEQVAISRFHVPKGSMRSFQNVHMLREKILTRIHNERAHLTIGKIAQSSGQR